MTRVVVTCGCCSDGCVCYNHMDIPNGRRPGLCAAHSFRDGQRVALLAGAGLPTESGVVVGAMVDQTVYVLVDEPIEPGDDRRRRRRACFVEPLVGHWPLPLTQVARGVLMAEVARDRLANMFGDGQEREYVMDGFPTCPGVRVATDEELLKERDPSMELDEHAALCEGLARIQMDVVS